MNADVLVGGIAALVCAPFVVRYVYDEARAAVAEWRGGSKPNPEVDQEAEQRFVAIDVSFGPVEFTFQTDHPVTPGDIRAVYVLVARQHGPVVGALVRRQIIEKVAAREAETLDADLAALGGAA